MPFAIFFKFADRHYSFVRLMQASCPYPSGAVADSPRRSPDAPSRPQRPAPPGGPFLFQGLGVRGSKASGESLALERRAARRFCAHVYTYTIEILCASRHSAAAQL